MEKEFIDIQDTLNRIRTKVSLLKENNEKTDGVPYTSNDELMSSSIEAAKTQFGADFSNHETPMLYYPQDGDVILSGTIPSLNNAKFQYRYKDSSGMGCYFWSDSLILNDENLTKVSRILGVFKNWKSDLEKSEDIKPMSLKNSEIQ